MPVVQKHSAEILDQPETLFELAQEHETAVAGDVATFERSPDSPAVKAGKMELGVGTVWPWRGFLGLAFNTINRRSLLRKPSQYFDLI